MRAIQLVEMDEPLQERAVELGAPGPGQVLVRIEAAGICHSDAHYRSGFPEVASLPITPGHEIAGVVEATGEGVASSAVGDRVAIHYQLSCGDCRLCMQGNEQFCPTGSMLGKDRDGGYAEHILVPESNAFSVPDAVAMDHAAVMMCSTATSYHALRKARLQPGERVAVFGVGGLGMSAIQLALIGGAADVFAVDVNPERLELAERLGAHPIPATEPAAAIRTAAGGGVEVALELAGHSSTTRQALDALAPMGRLVVVGLNAQPVPIRPYEDLITTEKEIIGNADHRSSEIPELLRLAESGQLDLGPVVTGRVPLDAMAINEALDALVAGTGETRTVINMGS